MTADLVLGKHNLTLVAGSIIEYDGTNIRVPETGQTVCEPLIAKVIAAGVAIVPISSKVTQYVPQSSNVQMHEPVGPAENRKQVQSAKVAFHEDKQIGTVNEVKARRVLSQAEADALNLAKLQELHEQHEINPYFKGQVNATLVTETTGRVNADRKGANKIERREDQGGRIVGKVIESKNPLVKVGSGEVEPFQADHVIPDRDYENGVRARSYSADRDYSDTFDAKSYSADRDYSESFTAKVIPSQESGGGLFGEDTTKVVRSVPGASHQQDPSVMASKIASSWDFNRPGSDRVTELVEDYAKSPAILNAVFAVETPGVVAKVKSALGMDLVAQPSPVVKPKAVRKKST